jgi:P4 family phage/plasmid primase-like protien
VQLTSIRLSIVEELRHAAGVLLQPGDVVELRAPKAGKRGTISGYYNDFERLVQDTADIDGEAPGVYWTLNPVNPDLLARAANRCVPYARDTTSDRDIVRRIWLPIDCDAQRPSGLSSTDAEHEAALERARTIRADLRELGWPDPVYADSGNGAHLLYRIDLPNDEAGRALVQRTLEALHFRYSDEVVKVDTTMFNAARICKAYGTWARKGDDVPERPHRQAQILERPEQLQAVGAEQLKALHEWLPDGPKENISGKRKSGDSFDVEDWISRHAVPVQKGPLPFSGGQRWITDCPNNADHKDAAILRLNSGAVVFKCFHDSCQSYGWREFRERYEPGCYANADSPARSADEERDSQSQNFTDLGNARRLVSRYGDRIRYVHHWNTWLLWDTRRWRADSTGHIQRLAKRTIKSMWDTRDEVNPELRQDFIKHILRSEHENRMKAMVNVAKSEPGIPISPDDVDRSPYLLNVLNGTLDLRTGELRPHDPADYITKLIPVAYDPAAKAREFMRFLIRVFKGDRHLIRFVQRAIGYSVTGDCREQVVFFCFGIGANGKSTLLNAVMHLLGTDYSLTMPSETLLMKKNGDGIPNDIARLTGTRFVVVPELEGQLNEGKLKRLTGEDKLTGRFMRAEFFDFTPTFKLWVACNNKPSIRASEYAMWRRMRLIPFEVTIPAEKQDKRLPEKLRAEAEGILAWAVRGCVAWQRHGLGTPDAVTTATEAYRMEMDVVGRFVGDWCDRNAGSRTPASELWLAYNFWSGENGEEPVSLTMFGRRMAGQPGVERVRGAANGGVVYSGIAVKADALNGLEQLKSFPDNRYSDAIKRNIRKCLQEPTNPSVPPKPPASEPGAAAAEAKEWVV